MQGGYGVQSSAHPLSRGRSDSDTDVPRAKDPDEKRRQGEETDDEREEHPGQDLNPERPR